MIGGLLKSYTIVVLLLVGMASAAEEAWDKIKTTYAAVPAHIKEIVGRKQRREAAKLFVVKRLASLSAEDHILAARQAFRAIRKKYADDPSRLEGIVTQTTRMCMELFFRKCDKDAGIELFERTWRDKTIETLVRSAFLRLVYMGPDEIRDKFLEDDRKVASRLAKSLKSLSCDNEEDPRIREDAFRARLSMLRRSWLKCVRGDSAAGAGFREWGKFGSIELSKKTATILSRLELELARVFSDARDELRQAKSPVRLQKAVRTLVSTSKAEGLPYMTSAVISSVISEVDSD